tara:strand:+ start:836 stop:2218 length:1383 start_codon:yes stop_codon:yes gene_type:complete
MKKNPARNVHLKVATSNLLDSINSSINIDKRLYKEDIEGSIAHCKTLMKSKIINLKDGKLIIKGLLEIEREIEKQKIKFDIKLEDIHMNIESILHKKIGKVAGKLHTARSRNDQVVTDLKLWIKKNILFLDDELRNFQKTLIKISKKNVNTVMPGYTHLQVAQAISLGHHFMAYVEMIGRDRHRLNNCFERTNQSPLGSGALAGTSYALNRNFTSKLLGFKKPTNNSIDSVSDRDFVIEFIFCLSLISVHLSRLAEEIILWASQQFRFIDLPDELSTGSSILPQKKNPDGAELVRAKSSICIANLNSILSLLKGLPLAYNKDLQEDKELTFKTYDNVFLCLKVMNEIIAKSKFNKKEMIGALSKSYATSIDLSEWLVKELKISFRKSYEISGKIVSYAILKNKYLHELSLEELRKFDKNINNKVFTILSAHNSIKNKKTFGGTSPELVKKAIKIAEKKYL